MQWHPDIPDDIPFEKPQEIERLESMHPKTRDSMRLVEIDESISAAAEQAAKAYKKAMNGNYDDCVLTVSSILSVTGNALGGLVGSTFVGESLPAAQKACRDRFSEEFPEDSY